MPTANQTWGQKCHQSCNDRSNQQSLTMKLSKMPRSYGGKKKKTLSPKRRRDLFKIASVDSACPAEFPLFEHFQNITHSARERTERKCQLSLMNAINGENGECERVETPGVKIISPQLLPSIWCINISLKVYTIAPRSPLRSRWRRRRKERCDLCVLANKTVAAKTVAFRKKHKTSPHFQTCRSFEFLPVIRSHASQTGETDCSARWCGKVISPRGEKVQA